MSEPLVFVVAAGEADRADKIVARKFPGASRRRIAALFGAGKVRVDGARAKKGDMVAAGSKVTLEQPPDTDEALRPLPDSALRLPVLHSDEWLVAINKPPGMPSHPLRAGEMGTAANGLVHQFPSCRSAGGDTREAGLVHRLDIGTSGILLAALDAETWKRTRELFHHGGVTKSYIALVMGHATSGHTDAPLLQRGPRVVVDYTGLTARTEWHVLKVIDDYTLVRCHATSGRMHQVRAHLSHAGYPLVGDLQYGGARIAQAPLTSHFLHADTLTLAHPRTGQKLSIIAPLSADRDATLTLLRDRARD